MKSSDQMAIEWEMSKRTINDLCNKGKIPGAVKEGRKWLIPDDAVRPADGRVSSGKYLKKKDGGTRPRRFGKTLNMERLQSLLLMNMIHQYRKDISM